MSAGATPIVAIGSGRYVVVVVAAVVLLAALGALEITKRPRRRSDGSVGPDPLRPRA